MRYKIFELSIEEEVIGRNVDQQADLVYEWFSPEDLKNYKSMFHGNAVSYWKRESVVPDFTMQVHAKLARRAKMTDFLNATAFMIGVPFLISQRALDIFRQFNISDYYTFPATIYNGLKEVITADYHMFYMPYLSYDVVDFPNCVFWQKRIKQEMVLPGIEAYKSLDFEFLKLRYLLPHKKPLDFFKPRLGMYYVSEALTKAIADNGLTGTDIRDPKGWQFEVAYK